PPTDVYPLSLHDALPISEAGDVAAQRRHRAVGRVLAPDLVDEQVGGDGGGRPGGQHGQHGPLRGAADRDDPAVCLHDIHRPEDADPHPDERRAVTSRAGCNRAATRRSHAGVMTTTIDAPLTTGWETDVPAGDTMLRRYLFCWSHLAEAFADAAGGRTTWTAGFAAADMR